MVTKLRYNFVTNFFKFVTPLFVTCFQPCQMPLVTNLFWLIFLYLVFVSFVSA